MRNRTMGTTALELAIALAVAATLVALAAPSFASLIERTRYNAASHDLSAGLAQARMLAVVRGQPVTLCPSRDGERCEATFDWSQGWITYLDPGRGAQPDHAGNVLLVVRRVGGGAQPRVETSSGRQRVRFQPDGTAGGHNLTFRICNADRSRTLGRVVVSRVGRARVERVETDREAPCDPA